MHGGDRAVYALRAAGADRSQVRCVNQGAHVDRVVLVHEEIIYYANEQFDHTMCSYI